MASFYLLAKRVHRLFVIIIIVLGLIMAVTGTVLKYPVKIINKDFARKTHNILSPFFGIVLIIMMITGFYLYLYPWLNKRKTEPA